MPSRREARRLRREARRARKKVRAADAVQGAPVTAEQSLKKTRLGPISTAGTFTSNGPVSELDSQSARVAQTFGTDVASAAAGLYHMQPFHAMAGVRRDELNQSGARPSVGMPIAGAQPCLLNSMRSSCASWNGASASEIINYDGQINRMPDAYDRLKQVDQDNADSRLMGQPEPKPLQGCVAIGDMEMCGLSTGKSSTMRKSFYAGAIPDDTASFASYANLRDVFNMY